MLSIREKNKRKLERRKITGVCLNCGRPRDDKRVFCLKCRTYKSKIDKLGGRRRKLLVIEHYGGKCACCNELVVEFLTLDHIKNNGASHRREINNRGGSEFYKWIIKNNFPEGFQILCWNCNCAKGYFGRCPHVKE